MGRVYLIPELEHERYFGTVRESRAAQRLMEEPERIVPLDAARECNTLLAQVNSLASQLIEWQVALKELIAIAPNDTLTDTYEGRQALAIVRKYDPDFLESCGL